MTYTIDSMSAGRAHTPLASGTRVDVRNRYVGTWSHGFDVVEWVDDLGYKVRRLSDGAVLPDVFDEDDLRLERRRNDFWWH